MSISPNAPTAFNFVSRSSLSVNRRSLGRSPRRKHPVAVVREDGDARLPCSCDPYWIERCPSSESLRAFPRDVFEILQRAAYALPWLAKVVEDLSQLDVDHRVVTRLCPVKTGVAKILAVGGHGVPTQRDVQSYASPDASEGWQGTR